MQPKMNLHINQCAQHQPTHKTNTFSTHIDRALLINQISNNTRKSRLDCELSILG